MTPGRCLIAALIFFTLMVAIGAIPGEAKILSDAAGDKLLHFSAYAFLSCLVYSGLTGSPVSRALRTQLAIVLLGGLDEAIQTFMPYRNANVTDWAFDIAAALLTTTAMALLTRTRTMAKQRLDRH